MNFLLHRELAAAALGSPAAAYGAMLPDLWPLADRRVRVARVEVAPAPAAEGGPDPRDAEVMSGIAHHLEADRWFHGADVFLAGEDRTEARFRQAAFVAPRMLLFAHITWELCLDGALIRRRGLAEVRRGLAASIAAGGDGPGDRAARRYHFDIARRGATPGDLAAFIDRMRAMEARLLAGPWIEAYAAGAGLARVIDHIRGRMSLPALGRRDLDALAEACDELLVEADAALDDALRGF